MSKKYTDDEIREMIKKLEFQDARVVLRDVLLESCVHEFMDLKARMAQFEILIASIQQLFK